MSVQAQHGLIVAALALLPATAVPVSAEESVDEPTGIVDCLLPGPIRRVGGMIYQMPGQPVRILASDCRLRGGDYLLYDRSNYDESLKHWISLAETGDADAMLYVGEIHEKGLGRDPDYAAAATWYRRAADEGNATAKISLAHLYKTGQGVELDLQAAQQLYSEALGADIPVPLDPTAVKGADQRVETLLAEVDEVRRQKTAVELELEAAREQLKQARTSLDAAISGNGANAEQIVSLRQSLEDQSAEIAAYRTRLDDMLAENRELRGLRHQLEEEKLETARLKEKLAAVEAEVETGRSALRSQRELLVQKESEFRELMSTVSTDQDRLRLQRSAAELDVMRGRISDLEAALHKSEEDRAMFQELASDAATNAERVATLSGRIELMERQAESRQSDFERLERQAAATETELETQIALANQDTSDEELAARDAEIGRLQAAVRRAEQETERHEREADRLSAQSVELERLRDNLEREQAQSNRLSQLLIESQDQFRQASRRIRDIENSRTALEQEIEELRAEQATGSAAASAALSERTAELDRAGTELVTLKAQIASLEGDFDQYRAQVGDTADRQREAISNLRVAVADSRAERSQLERKLVNANAQIESAMADLTSQRQRITDLQDDLLEVRAASDAKDAVLEDRERRLDDERRRVAGLEAEVERLQQETARYQAQLTELEAVEQAKEVEFAGPSILMLEPDETQLLASEKETRGNPADRGLAVIEAASAAETRFIHGRVDAPAGLAELTIDGYVVNVNERNVFTKTLKLGGESKLVRIVAVDHNGNRAERLFQYRVPGAQAAKVHSKQERFEIGRNKALDDLRYYALLIANKNYVDPWARDLETPVDDVNAIAQVLRERYNFEVETMIDTTKDELEEAFERIFYHEESDDDPDNDKDAILIYYAGHGLLSDSRTDNAYYWAPVDAVENSPRTWFRTRTIEDYMKNSGTKQIMVVADSCFAGKVLSRDGTGMKHASEKSRNFNKMLVEYTQRKASRFVLTSGGNAPVLDGGGGDHSVFALAFLNVLRSNEDIISGSTLFERLSGEVMFLAEKQNFFQAPEFGYLRSAGHESGVFFLPAPQFPANITASE